MINRRGFLKTGLIGCCAAASPFATTMTLAGAPGENRLVIIILRGAMDGLDVFAPYGDRAYKKLRPSILRNSKKTRVDLDGRFAMHAALSPLKDLWRHGELGVAHAVSTPYRDKRSHFDGQDILETGVSDAPAGHSGWLNRALAHMPGASTGTALSAGRESMLLLQGDNPAYAWSPGDRLALHSDTGGLLNVLYAKDPLFHNAAAAARELSMNDDTAFANKADRMEELARYAGGQLSGEARIAAFSIGGWDTHANQKKAIVRPLEQLALAITTLRAALGPHWSRTMVIAMTEFGRTAHENGSGGTDHGTAGAALLAGGALKGGKVYGDWPGLRENELYQGRDLMPTMDVRHYPAWALTGLFGLSRTAVMRDVFPGLEMGSSASFIA
jgi:uncharacterized protein (DUF1501 family)